MVLATKALLGTTIGARVHQQQGGKRGRMGERGKETKVDKGPRRLTIWVCKAVTLQFLVHFDL